MDAALRGQFTAAVMALANYCPSGCTPCNSLSCTSAYDIFVLLHQAGTAPSAHGGASFLPWHREFIWRYVYRIETYKNSNVSYFVKIYFI